ncbi:MAG: hypothetical protein HY791_24075 [Deltaproteobacteria bacterium]|nr:hypothetical protein [Deltaproteobacteria bacterium]
MIALAFLVLVAEGEALAAGPCVPEERFWAELKVRRPDLEVSGLEGLRVTFTATTGALIGELVFEDRPSSVRSIAGTRCEEVSGALALIAALALESPVERPRPTPIVYVPPPATPARDGSRWQVGASVSLLAGPIPWPSLGFGPFAEAELSSWGVRIAVILARGSAAGTSASGEFVLSSLRVSGCTPKLSVSALAARVCGFADLGAIAASGAGPADTQSSLRFYSAAGPALQVALELSPVSFEVEGTLGAPFLRDRFVLLDAAGGVFGTVHEVPGLVGSVAASAALRFGE